MVNSPSVPHFLTGINYWPRRSAMYMWQRFDSGAVAHEMAHIASLGLDIVRFFLHWEDFQPSPDAIDPVMLARLTDVMDAIADAGLRAMPTLFTGHMSGVNWLPEWTLDPATPHGRFRTYSKNGERPFGIGDFYKGALLDAQVLHARTVGERLRGHPALYMWDLGNEFSNLREPDNPHDAATWSATLTDALLETSGAPVTSGTHGEDITRDRHLRLSSLCSPYDIATMHGYSVYSNFARNRLDADVVPFLNQIAQSCSGKPVLFSEFGNPTCRPGTVSPYDRVPLPGEPPIVAESLPENACDYACLTEDEMCTYAYNVLDRLQRAGSLGGFWWCYADYSQEVAALPPFDKAPHELSFGIVRHDGTEKPVAAALKAFAAEKRAVVPLPPAIVDETAYFSHFEDSVYQAYARYTQTEHA